MVSAHTGEGSSPVELVHTGSTHREVHPGIALCLSGGGYRAMLFHVGTLWRLYETGVLAETPTRLKRLDTRHQERLINWGYAVCDAAIRKSTDEYEKATKAMNEAAKETKEAIDSLAKLDQAIGKVANAIGKVTGLLAKVG